MNLPEEINIIEVGPRDGFQNIKEFIATDVKIDIIKRLIDANIKKIEVTSFVNPKLIPQMSDAREVFQSVCDKVKCLVLVPNLKGAEMAVEAGAKIITMVISSTESHNMANTNHTISASLKEMSEISKICQSNGVRLRLDLATAFGCPFEGKVSIRSLKNIVYAAGQSGIRELVLCDTTGMANPLMVEKTVKELGTESGNIVFGVHFHNTRGTGIANILTAVTLGINNIETSVGGLGGCPFAPGASGNVATEDIVNMFHDMGIKTGINLNKLLNCSRYLYGLFDNKLSSHTLIAGTTYSGQKCLEGVKSERNQIG